MHKVIVTRINEQGTYDEVGMRNRTVITGLTSVPGILHRARTFANGKSFRVEWYTESTFYSTKPSKVTLHG